MTTAPPQRAAGPATDSVGLRAGRRSCHTGLAVPGRKIGGAGARLAGSASDESERGTTAVCGAGRGRA